MTFLLHKMTNEKKRFYKYLSVSEEAKRWGLYVAGAGHIKVGKNVEYPLVDDPSHHYFHYSLGRRLFDYQILYITRGDGIFETEVTGVRKVSAGDIFILFPGIWHRFAPDPSTGWDEYWVEFNGDFVRQYRTREFLNPDRPIYNVGIQEEIVDNFDKIINLIKEGKPGFQFIASGNLIQILGLLFALQKYHPFEGKIIENQIKQAKFLIQENMANTLHQGEIANEIGIGYSLFRKKFKEYTGVSPTQYQIQLRTNKAKDLLIRSNLGLKEIAHNLGFTSTYYFCRLFKKKTSFTPSDYREKNKR